MVCSAATEMKGIEMTAVPGTSILPEGYALRIRIAAHQRAACDWSNTLGSVWGWGSPNGRKLQQPDVLNLAAAANLDELAWKHGYPDGHRAPEPEPTPAAAEMTRRQLRRTDGRGCCGRLVPMTAAAKTAALAYLDERIALVEAAINLCNRHKADVYSITKRQLRAMRRLRPLIVGTAATD